MHDLIDQEKWIQIYKLVKRHNMVHGQKSLPGFASEIRIEKVLSHLIKDFQNDKCAKLIEGIVDCFILNGGILDQGKFVNTFIPCNASND